MIQSHSKPRSCRGFTLVELMVVVGVVALLAAILMPALGKARESANRARCLSNLRQLAGAFLMYGEDQNGRYPSATAYKRAVQMPYTPALGATDEDWIYWQPYRDVNDSPVAKYLAARNEALARVLTCPTDRPNDRPAPAPFEAPDPAEGKYRFSYTMNQRIGLQKAVWVVRSSDKILLTEEAAPNDGCFFPNNVEDLLTLRHGRAWATDANGARYAAGVNVNAAFCDGHAAAITQQAADDPRNTAVGAQ